jgi:ATP-dependent RNA helicase DDX56/DBP9
MSSTASLLDPGDTFATLCAAVGLDSRLRKGLSRLGYVRPTLVQSKCLPLAINSGRDLLVRARTGSGKTLAYCLPLLQKVLMENNSEGNQIMNQDGFVKGVILVPTRELCTQVSNTLNSLIYYCEDDVSIVSLFSGKNSSETSMKQQEALLRDRPDIIVSTPSGLLAHINRENSLLKNTLKYSVKTLVVDEADLVLSFGYANDVTEIMKYLPRICQGFLMSATLSPELNSLKKVVLHSPAVLKLEEDDQELKNRKRGNLTQFYLALPKKDKFLVIYVFLKLGLLKGKGLFFVNTTDGGYRLKLFLEQFHIRSAVLNAELPLRSRLNIIEQFNVGNFDYLIATDESTDTSTSKKKDNDDDEVQDEKKKKSKRKKDSEYGVARGLDFRGVSFVLNVDFPVSPSSYTHRVGRTARGGAKGVAFSLVEIDNMTQLDMLAQVQESQPPLPMARTNGTNEELLTTAPTMNEDELPPDTIPQPNALDFDLKEIEGFRYRVEDVSRAVTKVAVKETRAAELKAEILNSQRLQNHFSENPNELQLLRHDRQATHVSRVQDHLKHVPKYLLPRGMQVAETKKRRKRKIKGNRLGHRRTDNDPLQSFNEDDVNLDGIADVENSNDDSIDFGFEDPMDMDETDVNDGSGPTGRSTAGRNAWQRNHGRGKFSKKYKKKHEIL